MSNYYTLTELEQFTSKISKFKYQGCAMHRNRIAFGAAAGSVHIYNLSDPGTPVVVSIPSVVTSVTLLSFSPGGKYLAVGGNNSIHFIEDPLTTPVTGYSIDLKGKRPVAFHWLCSPPGKLERKTPFLIAGDDTGSIWIIAHQGAELIGNVNSPVVQIDQINNSIIVASTSGTAFINEERMVIPVKGRRLNGTFGGVYSKDFDAVFLARADGKLLIMDSSMKSKTLIPLLESQKDYQPPEGFSTNLSYLIICKPFLISVGPGCLTYIVNLNSVSIDTVKAEQDFVDYSVFGNSAVLMFRDKIQLFHACETATEYYKILLKDKEYTKLQKLLVENAVKDKKLLEKANVDPSEEFTEYLHKVELESQPQPLKLVNPGLFDRFTSLDIPSFDMMKELESLLPVTVLEEEIIEKVRTFVGANPLEWKHWRSFVNVDELVAKLNEDEANAESVAALAKHGTETLCHLIHNAASTDLDLLVANSPPIRPWNIDKARRAEYIARLKELDPYIQPDIYGVNSSDKSDKNSEEDDILIDSLYSKEASTFEKEEMTPEAVHRLLKLSRWEQQIADAIVDLSTQAEAFMLGRGHGAIPPWVSQLVEAETAGRAVPSAAGDGRRDGGQHWGAAVDLSACPVCGMALGLKEASSSVAAFPCRHTYHLACLHTRYCPLCYSQCLH